MVVAPAFADRRAILLIQRFLVPLMLLGAIDAVSAWLFCADGGIAAEIGPSRHRE
jgi:hypothetical protein